jgi:hypothetical protein
MRRTIKRNCIAIMMPVVLGCWICWTWYSNVLFYNMSSAPNDVTTTLLLHNQNNNKDDIIGSRQNNNNANKISGGSYICPSALNLFNNITELRGAIDSQIQFHQRGGNLASITNYLNDQMQSTLDRLEIEFVPKQQEDGRQQLPSVQYLQQYYKTHKVKRGGCE